MPSTRERARRVGRVVLRGLVYALAITLLVLWSSAGPEVFIYQDF